MPNQIFYLNVCQQTLGPRDSGVPVSCCRARCSSEDLWLDPADTCSLVLAKPSEGVTQSPANLCVVGLWEKQTSQCTKTLTFNVTAPPACCSAVYTCSWMWICFAIPAFGTAGPPVAADNMSVNNQKQRRGNLFGANDSLACSGFALVNYYIIKYYYFYRNWMASHPTGINAAS